MKRHGKLTDSTDVRTFADEESPTGYATRLGKLARAAMPAGEDNDIDLGEGIRHKQPIRYD